jgi:hypothetical protein
VVFTGREHATTTHTHESKHEAKGMSKLLEIRTTCICVFRFFAARGGWRLVYHHVALDDPDQLARYQHAVRSV